MTGPWDGSHPEQRPTEREVALALALKQAELALMFGEQALTLADGGIGLTNDTKPTLNLVDDVIRPVLKEYNRAVWASTVPPERDELLGGPFFAFGDAP